MQSQIKTEKQIKIYQNKKTSQCTGNCINRNEQNIFIQSQMDESGMDINRNIRRLDAVDSGFRRRTV